VSSFVLWSKSWVGISKFGVHHPEAERFEEGAEPINATTSKRSVVRGRTVNLDQDPQTWWWKWTLPTLTRMLCMQNGDTGVMALRWQGSQNLSTQMGKYQEVANSPIFPGCSRRSSTGFWSSAKLRGEAQAESSIWVQENKHNPSLPHKPP